MRVVYFATYLTRVDSSWRDEDHNASKFVKALKGESFRGYAKVPVGRRVERLTQHNASSAVDWFAEMAASWLKRNGPEGPILLVPVPNSDSVVGTSAAPRTERAAREIVSRLGGTAASVRDCLRFDQRMPSAHRGGGTRDPALLYEHLVAGGRLRGATVVLVDDVLTGGGHLQACAARLRDAGAVAPLAVVAGRTVQAQTDEPFSTHVEEIEDWAPGRSIDF